MKLRDLKNSISKYPPDMDDMEVIFQVARNNKVQRENLCFVAYQPLDDNGCIILGGLTAVQHMVESGQMEKPEGYIPPEITNKYVFGEDSPIS